MHRFANLTMLWLTLLCFMSISYAQEVSALAERVSSVMRARPSCWRLNRVQERREGERIIFEQDWLCHNESVTIYFYQESSVEAAARLFEVIRSAPVAAPGRLVDSHRFGDESFITSYSAYSRSSYVFFRKDNIVVRIDSSTLTVRNATWERTLRNAVRFAQIVVEQIMPPPNNAMQPTATSAAFICKAWMLDTLNARRVMAGVRRSVLKYLEKA